MIKRVIWKDKDWKDVAMELYRQKPIETMGSSTLVGVSRDDVKSAMKKAIPESHWRISFNMTELRPRLLAEFKAIKKQLEIAEREQEEREREQEEIRAQEVKVKAQSDIFQPVLKLLAEELFHLLKPMIDQYLDNCRSNPILNTSPIDGIVTQHRESAIRPATPPRKRKPRVGIIGLIPIQAKDMEKSYPQLEFICIEDGNKTQEIKSRLSNNIAVVFGLTTKMRHNAEAVLKGMSVWNRYIRIAGKGPSSVRRAIDEWLEKQAIV